jgi:hypothetical protein
VVRECAVSVTQVAYAIYAADGHLRSSGVWLTQANAIAAAAALHGYAEVRPTLVSDQEWDTALLRDSIVTTTATSGHPGVFTPYGAHPPADLAGMSGITEAPTTRWVVGEYVVTADDLSCHWDGSAWALGRSVRVATAGTPGSFFGGVPATFVALVAAGVVASPTTPWSTGESVALVDSSAAHWSGTAWVVGAA